MPRSSITPRRGVTRHGVVDYSNFRTPLVPSAEVAASDLDLLERMGSVGVRPSGRMSSLAGPPSGRPCGGRNVQRMQIRDHLGSGQPRETRHRDVPVRRRGHLRGSWTRRANQLAHHFRSRGVLEGDAVAILMENSEHVHAVMWAARRGGAVLRTDQHPPHGGRGRVHRRQQQREGPSSVPVGSAHTLLGPAGRTARWVCPRSFSSPTDRRCLRLQPPRLAAISGVRCRSTRYAHRRRDRGRPAAVLVGHHRAAEGHQAGAAARRAVRGAGDDVGAGRVLDRTPTRST